MVDKNYCMSSYLAFRFIEKDDYDFFPGLKHKILKKTNEEVNLIFSYNDINNYISIDFEETLSKYSKKALLLSGGMDSAILASYMQGCDAYTFRFDGGVYQQDELRRAELFAKINKMKLHYVDINWNNTVEKYLDSLMKERCCPVHSIEPQIMQAAIQAKNDGVDIMIIGSASDDIFGGLDKLLSKDWKYEEFKNRYMFTNPKDVLVEPVDMDYAFAPYKYNCDKIDFMSFLDGNCAVETDLSFKNAFETAKMMFFDPYSHLKMGYPLDLQRIRNGESKYLIRELFSMKYPEFEVPEKIPMPRPVDLYFKNWEGPKRYEFKNNLNMNSFTGNQKWQLFCLERFLNLYE